jgi:hypothetical protein
LGHQRFGQTYRIDLSLLPWLKEGYGPLVLALALVPQLFKQEFLS